MRYNKPISIRSEKTSLLSARRRPALSSTSSKRPQSDVSYASRRFLHRLATRLTAQPSRPPTLAVAFRTHSA